MSFRSDLEKAHQKKVVEFQDRVTRTLAIDIQADLSRSTPVDSGRARSNWFGSVGSPNTTATNNTGGLTAINFAGFINGATIFLANNLPYIRRLNEGHSQQAPAAFVEAVVQRNVARVRQIIARVKP